VAAAKGRIRIDFERCKACELCIPVCPKDCIELGKELNAQGYTAAVFARAEPCTGCALCAEVCPDVAIQVWRS
jgi:2-oxoglutarate ferredoxin oxidoreductase subunit delta